MKSVLSIFVLLPALLAQSCTEKADVNPLACRVQTHVRINTYQTITVTYDLSATGDHKINQWYYYGPDGKTIQNNPQLPASVTVTLGPNDSIYAGAKGEITLGSMRVSYRAVAADTLFTASDLCIQNLNATPVLP